MIIQHGDCWKPEEDVLSGGMTESRRGYDLNSRHVACELVKGRRSASEPVVADVQWPSKPEGSGEVGRQPQRDGRPEISPAVYHVGCVPE